MIKNSFFIALVLIVMFVQCKKTVTETPPSLTDTIVAGTVEVYDGFGQSVTPTPIVNVTAFKADSNGVISEKHPITADGAGEYRFEQLPRGAYSLLFESEGYGEYVYNGVNFDSLAPLLIPPVKLTTKASGEVYLHGIDMSQSQHGIIEFDREIVFGAGASGDFLLKTRYLFGLDSTVAQGNSFYTFVSGAIEGASGTSNRQSVKFGLVNLKTFIPDSTKIFVVAAVETAPSESYTIGQYIVYPNVEFPLYPIQSFTYVIPVEE